MQLTFAWAGFESTTHFSLSGAECGSCHIDVQSGGQAAFNCGGLGAVHHNPERERAEALGWTAQDLFGLHDPPEQRGPNYRRLSRYDVVGLIRLLHGRPVVALTADRAVDRHSGRRSYANLVHDEGAETCCLVWSRPNRRQGD